MSKPLKTQKNTKDVKSFLDSVENETRKSDGQALLKIMKKVSGEKPKMWGDSIVGFGTMNYKRSDGTEYEWFQIGFSPRKASLSLYLMGCVYRLDEIKEFEELGKFKVGKGCLYINKLADVDLEVLEKIIKLGWEGNYQENK